MDSETSARIAGLQAQVDRIERAVAFMLNHLQLSYKDEHIASLPDDVAQLVRDGKMMEAIQAYRAATGVSLGEAQKVVQGADIDPLF